jgi:hypothetical protein
VTRVERRHGGLDGRQQAKHVADAHVERPFPGKLGRAVSRRIGLFVYLDEDDVPDPRAAEVFEVAALSVAEEGARGGREARVAGCVLSRLVVALFWGVVPDVRRLAAEGEDDEASE